MSTSDAAPLPKLGEVFFDVRGEERTMRLSWYADTGIAVFSIWHGGTCTGTFRLPMDDLPRMMEALRRGPQAAGEDGDLPAGASRRAPRRRDRADLPGGPQDEIVTGESAGYRDDPLAPGYRVDPERSAGGLPPGGLPAGGMPDAPTSVYPGPAPQGRARGPRTRRDDDDPLSDSYPGARPRGRRGRGDPLTAPAAPESPAIPPTGPPAGHAARGGYPGERPAGRRPDPRDAYAGAADPYAGPADPYDPSADPYAGHAEPYPEDRGGIAGPYPSGPLDRAGPDAFERSETADWDDEDADPGWDEESRLDDPAGDGGWDDDDEEHAASRWDDEGGADPGWDDDSGMTGPASPARGGRHNAPPPESFPYGHARERGAGRRGRHPGRH